jgi:hypothetical protein
MARTLLNEEYINKRAEDHNKWLADADLVWKTRRERLPYPPFAPYPTEAQILERAEQLLKFVVDDKESEVEEPVEQAPAAGPLFSNLDEVTKKINKVKQVLTAQDIIDENKEK